MHIKITDSIIIVLWNIVLQGNKLIKIYWSISEQYSLTSYQSLEETRKACVFN